MECEHCQARTGGKLCPDCGDEMNYQGTNGGQKAGTDYHCKTCDRTWTRIRTYTKRITEPG